MKSFSQIHIRYHPPTETQQKRGLEDVVRFSQGYVLVITVVITRWNDGLYQLRLVTTSPFGYVLVIFSIPQVRGVWWIDAGAGVVTVDLNRLVTAVTAAGDFFAQDSEEGQLNVWKPNRNQYTSGWKNNQWSFLNHTVYQRESCNDNKISTVL